MKWTFVLAPLMPLGFATAALVFLNARGYPVENVLYLWVLLALWDPWHFLMQHYGFTRIYDRYNGAPKKLAARMDLVLSAAWFVFIMLASGDWLVGVLEDLFTAAHLPAAALFRAAVVDALTKVMLAAATLATLAYGAYLEWCRRRGYGVSLVKLALLVTTFGVMFVAYTPNAWISSWAPGWTFGVGFCRDRHRPHDPVPRDRLALQPRSHGATGQGPRRRVPRAARPRRLARGLARTSASVCCTA